jgi:hypothetical protein
MIAVVVACYVRDAAAEDDKLSVSVGMFHHQSPQSLVQSSAITRCRYRLWLESQSMIAPVEPSRLRTPPAVPSPRHGEQYSSQNLIVNGGFSVMSPGGMSGWHVSPQPGHDTAWQRVATPTFDHAGLPLSTYAIQATVPGKTGASSIWQNVRMQHGSFRHLVFRLAGRSIRGKPTFCLRVIAILPSGELHMLAEARFAASPRWERYRVVFEVESPFPPAALRVVIVGPTETDSSAQFTDLRLIFLCAPQTPFAIRFDTCGDLARGSSRLRAWLFEDYLHLLGWPTSMNKGNSFALCICQKVRPWLRLLHARWRRRAVIYDLDDNDLLLSTREAYGIRRFVRLVSGATAGSEFLRHMLGQWNPHVALLEDPVDVLDRDVVHNHEEWRGSLVWFGNPENLWMLRELALDHPVTTITRGGDLEYGPKTVDEQLVTFDLALLPVFLNDETRAKNANRLVKCIGLGLPFLASDTPEHRRALERLQLPDIFLIASPSEWSARINDVACRYEHYRRLIQGARAAAFDAYGIERIASKWVAFCSGRLAAAAAPIDDPV